MAFRCFVTVSFLAIVVAGAALLVQAGWVPWTVPIAFLIFALVVTGYQVRRRRGTRPTSAAIPHPLPGREAVAAERG